jgi:hypothetical protein
MNPWSTALEVSTLTITSLMQLTRVRYDIRLTLASWGNNDNYVRPISVFVEGMTDITSHRFKLKCFVRFCDKIMMLHIPRIKQKVNTIRIEINHETECVLSFNMG